MCESGARLRALIPTRRTQHHLARGDAPPSETGTAAGSRGPDLQSDNALIAYRKRIDEQDQCAFFSRLDLSFKEQVEASLP